MTVTYTPIASQTLATSAASVTFSSIPQDYRDLVLVVKASVDTADRYSRATFNGDSGSNYSYVKMMGNGSSTFSNAATNTFMAFGYGQGFDTTGNQILQLQIMDYSATDKHKSCLERWDDASGETVAGAHRWANTSAITTINIFLNAGTFQSGSVFSLFGIAA